MTDFDQYETRKDQIKTFDTNKRNSEEEVKL